MSLPWKGAKRDVAALLLEARRGGNHGGPRDHVVCVAVQQNGRRWLSAIPMRVFAPCRELSSYGSDAAKAARSSERQAEAQRGRTAI